MEYETSVCTEDYFYKSGFFWQSKEKVTRPVWKEPEIVQSFGECIRNCNLTAFHLLFMNTVGRSSSKTMKENKQNWL